MKIELTRDELIIIQDLVSKEKLRLQENDLNNEIEVVIKLNARLRYELNI